MTRLTMIGAAAIVASALASPASAQQVIRNPGNCAQFHPDANCQNLGPGNPNTGGHQRHRAYYRTERGPGRYVERNEARIGNNGWNDNWNNGRDNGWNDNWNTSWNNGWNDNWNNGWHTGFWPGDVAGDVVGGAVGTAGAVAAGAVGTAGAIATAPFRANSYAYDNGWNDNGWNDNWGWDHQTYAQRNGFVCTPGTYFKAANGTRQLCQ